MTSYRSLLGFLSSSLLSLAPLAAQSPAIVYVDGGIRVMNADGSGQRLLMSTKGSNYVRGPAWSADGQKIAFYGYLGGARGIYTMNADGSGRALVAGVAFTAAFPDWSPAPAPDGREKLVFSDRPTGGTYDLFVVDRDGTGYVNLTNTPSQHETYACWSHDGQSLIAIRDGALVRLHLGVVGGLLAVTGETTLSASGNSSFPRSARTRDAVAYCQLTASRLRVFVLELGPTPGTPELLTSTATYDERFPCFSPDDSRLVFHRGGTGGGIFTILADGTGAVRIHSRGTDPHWRP